MSNTCVADTCVIHMFYTCNTPKTPHMYYRCGTIAHVGNCLKILPLSTETENQLLVSKMVMTVRHLNICFRHNAADCLQPHILHKTKAMYLP